MLNNELLRAFSSRQFYKTPGENPFIELMLHNKQAGDVGIFMVTILEVIYALSIDDYYVVEYDTLWIVIVQST